MATDVIGMAPVMDMGMDVTDIIPAVATMTPDAVDPAVATMTPDAVDMAPAVATMTPDAVDMAPAVATMTPDAVDMAPAVATMAPGATTLAMDAVIPGTIIQATTIIVATRDIASPAVRILTAGSKG